MNSRQNFDRMINLSTHKYLLNIFIDSTSSKTLEILYNLIYFSNNKEIKINYKLRWSNNSSCVLHIYIYTTSTFIFIHIYVYVKKILPCIIKQIEAQFRFNRELVILILVQI